MSGDYAWRSYRGNPKEILLKAGHAVEEELVGGTLVWAVVVKTSTQEFYGVAQLKGSDEPKTVMSCCITHLKEGLMEMAQQELLIAQPGVMRLDS